MPTQLAQERVRRALALDVVPAFGVDKDARVERDPP